MNSIVRAISLSTLALLQLIFFSESLRAQDMLRYDSLYQPMLGVSGHARFTYKLSKTGETIKQGGFEFESKTKDSLQPALFIQENWMGNFVENKKQGQWQYRKNRQLVHVEDINEWEVKYQLKTEERLLKSNYTLGKPDKEWELSRTIFVNKQPVTETEFVKTTLRNERFEGKIELYYLPDSVRSCRINGFARNGLMDSTWMFELKNGDTTYTERREYKKGFLLSLVRWNGADTILSLQYPLSSIIRSALYENSGTEQVLDHPVSITFSDGYPRTSPYIRAQHAGNSYLETVLTQLFQYEGNWIKEKGLPLGTSRGFYVLSAKEKNLLENWPELEYTFRERVKRIAANFDTTVVATTHPGLIFIKGWAEKQRNLLDYIKPWNNILSRNEIEYYHRRGELVDYSIEILGEDSIQLDDENTTVLKYPVNTLDQQDFLTYISSNFQRRIRTADSLLVQLDKIRGELAVLSENQQLLNSVQEIRKETDQLFSDSSKHEMIDPLYQKLRTEFAATEFNRLYRKFVDSATTAKKPIADSLMYLLSSLQIVSEMLDVLPSRQTQIDSLYTIYTFDPFTFNDKFPRRIKKKLYDIIAIDLYNSELRKLTTSTNISEIKTGVKLLYDIQERLIFLHDKDTRKIERKLKKGSSTQAKMEAIKG